MEFSATKVRARNDLCCNYVESYSCESRVPKFVLSRKGLPKKFNIIFLSGRFAVEQDWFYYFMLLLRRKISKMNPE
jgi:hypothetical protein